MAEISKIEIGGVEYDIKDETARANGGGLTLIGSVTERFDYNYDYDSGVFTKLELFGQSLLGKTEDVHGIITIQCPEELRVLAREAKFVKIRLVLMDSATWTDAVRGMYPCSLCKDNSLPVSFGVNGYADEPSGDLWFDGVDENYSWMEFEMYMKDIAGLLENLYYGYLEYTFEFYA